MTEKTLEEIKAWAKEREQKYLQDYLVAPHYLSSHNGIHMSSNGEEKGRYQVAVDLCIFLGLQDEI